MQFALCPIEKEVVSDETSPLTKTHALQIQCLIKKDCSTPHSIPVLHHLEPAFFFWVFADAHHPLAFLNVIDSHEAWSDKDIPRGNCATQKPMEKNIKMYVQLWESRDKYKESVKRHKGPHYVYLEVLCLDTVVRVQVYTTPSKISILHYFSLAITGLSYGKSSHACAPFNNHNKHETMGPVLSIISHPPALCLIILNFHIMIS